MAGALGYAEVGEYLELAAGSYAVSVRPAGAPRSAPPALSARVEVPAGGARTLALSGSFADLVLAPPPDDDLTAPAPGTARVRVLAAAGTATTVDVAVDGGPVLAAGLPFPATSGYADMRGGSATLRLSTPTGTTTLPVDLPAGTVASLLVLDAPGGGVTARVVLDAAAPAVVPVGAVAAGAGGPVAVSGGVLPPLRAGVTGLLARAAHAAAAPTAPPAVASGSAPPVRVRAPAADLDAALTGVGLDATGALAVPGASVAGWYTAGPVPGQRGPAVLAGHVDWAGRPGAFGGLHRLAAGDDVVVDLADGSSRRFTVLRVAQVAKDAFPTAAVYGAVPGAELRLITCGGRFDPSTGSYPDNVVVFAQLVL